MTDLRASAEFAALRDLAARLGSEPLQIQGPGGNVSIKRGGQMLVKASGTWLADAQDRDIFAEVDAEAMRSAVEAGDPAADVPARFQIGDGLRPSIETSFHASLDAPVVLHTHCVATLARSTRPIPKTELDALRLVQVPYVMPGADLARAVLEAWHPGARGAVLSNHGIITTGNSVAEADAILRTAARAFEPGIAPPQTAPDPTLAADLDGTGWQALEAGATTALAFDRNRRALCEGGALCPDQVIFLGPTPEVSDVPPQPVAGLPAPLWIVADRGAALRDDASPAIHALATMLGEVAYRLPAAPTRLTEDQALALLGWDAERHRQELEKARTERLKSAPK